MPFHPPRGFRASLLEGAAKVGLMIGTGSAQLVELAAVAGLDYAFIDCEHGDGDIGDVLQMIRAADAFGVPVIVRVPSNDPSAIQRVLDYGAIGICVPHVRTREDAERAVRYAKYAPQGVRAMSPFVRSAGYTVTGWPETWRVANEETLVIAIVEDREAVESVEAIAAVPGVDVIWIGVGDLSQDMGVAGEAGFRPAVGPAVARGLKAARANGKASLTSVIASAHVAAAERLEHFTRAYRDGHRLFFLTDSDLVGGGLAEIGRVIKASLHPLPVSS
jgi:4-hydroxy-2-oxoheptanedioate aldolase